MRVPKVVFLDKIVAELDRPLVLLLCLDLLPILLNRQGAGLLVRPSCHLELPDPGIGATSGQDNKVG